MGIMEKKMETTWNNSCLYRSHMFGLYWGYIGIMEKEMETTGIIGIIQGLYRGYIGVIL